SSFPRAWSMAASNSAPCCSIQSKPMLKVTQAAASQAPSSDRSHRYRSVSSRAASRALAASFSVFRSSMCRSSACAYWRSRSIKSFISHLLVVVAQQGAEFVGEQLVVVAGELADAVLVADAVPLVRLLPQRLRQPLGKALLVSLQPLLFQRVFRCLPDAFEDSGCWLLFSVAAEVERLAHFRP